MNEKMLQRYLKVKALAERGSPGEKENAQRILQNLQQRHAGIDRAALEYLRQADLRHQQARATGTAGATGAHTPAPASSQTVWGRWSTRARSGNWEEIFRYASGVYQTIQTAVDMIEEASEADLGTELAEYVAMDGTSSRKNLFIRVTFPKPVVSDARRMNLIQKQAFRQALHEEFDAFLGAVLGEDS